MDGRILTEQPGALLHRTLEVTNGHWRQYLKISTAGRALYLDEGNGQANP